MIIAIYSMNVLIDTMINIINKKAIIYPTIFNTDNQSSFEPYNINANRIINININIKFDNSSAPFLSREYREEKAYCSRYKREREYCYKYAFPAETLGHFAKENACRGATCIAECIEKTCEQAGIHFVAVIEREHTCDNVVGSRHHARKTREEYHCEKHASHGVDKVNAERKRERCAEEDAVDK